jgi:hypothetical protein
MSVSNSFAIQNWVITPGDHAGYDGDDVGFSKAAAEIEGGSFDAAAAGLLDAATTFTKSAFRLPSLQLTRAVTRRSEKEGDVLYAEWSFS